MFLLSLLLKCSQRIVTGELSDKMWIFPWLRVWTEFQFSAVNGSFMFLLFGTGKYKRSSPKRSEPHIPVFRGIGFDCESFSRDYWMSVPQPGTFVVTHFGYFSKNPRSRPNGLSRQDKFHQRALPMGIGF